jgi:hypothetical protein
MAIFKGSLKAIKEDWKSALKYVIAGVVGFSVWMIIGFLLGQHKLPTSYPSGEYIEIAGSQWFFIGLLGPIGLFGGAFLGLPSKNPKRILKLAIVGFISFVAIFPIHLFASLLSESLLFLQFLISPSSFYFDVFSVVSIGILGLIVPIGIVGLALGSIIGLFLGAVLKNKKELTILGGVGMLIGSIQKITVFGPDWFEFLTPFTVLGAFLGLGIYITERKSEGEKK